MEVGTVQKGYRYLGGDPSLKENWERAEEEGPTGSSVGRFLGGLSETLLPDMETIKRVGMAAPEAMTPMVASQGEDGVDVRLGRGPQLALDVLLGMGSGAMDQFSKAKELAGTGASDVEVAGRIAAGLIPAIGPAAAEAGETIGEGDIAGGLGQATGLTLPFIRPLKMAGAATGAGKKIAGGLKESAKKSTVRALHPKPADVETLMADAPSISEGMGVGSAARLEKRARGQLKQSEDALDVIKTKEAARPVDIADVPDQIRGQRKKLVHPEKRNEAGEVIPDDTPKSLYKGERQAFDDAAKEIEDQLLAWDDDVIPAGEVFEMRSAAGRQAADLGAFNKMPGAPKPPRAGAKLAQQKALSEKLKEQIPGLYKADLDMNTWKKVEQTLRDSAATAAMAPPGAAAAVALRNAMKTAITGSLLGAGAATGGGAGAVLGVTGAAYGLFQVSRDILKSPLWNSLSAKAKFKLAEEIGNGLIPRTVIATETVDQAIREDEEELPDE